MAVGGSVSIQICISRISFNLLHKNGPNRTRMTARSLGRRLLR